MGRMLSKWKTASLGSPPAWAWRVGDGAEAVSGVRKSNGRVAARVVGSVRDWKSVVVPVVNE